MSNYQVQKDQMSGGSHIIFFQNRNSFYFNGIRIISLVFFSELIH